jgi:iron(III) transport system ATP-binding protein
VVAVTLQRVSKSFARAGVVVDAMDLDIRQGEFFTLLGPSGCGKSTLLRIIAGFDTPSTGRVLFDDRDVTGDAPHTRSIGFAFQNYALFPHLSVFENVAFGLQVRKLRRGEIAARVKEALAAVSLDGCDAERVHRLSGGQQQRVALARALVLRPRLLLLDEPLSNLDARLRQDARALLGRIHGSLGCTIVYVTHDQMEAMTMSDRIAVLAGGRLQQVAAPQEIYERPATLFVADFIGRNNVIAAALTDTDELRPLVTFDDGTELRLAPEVRFDADLIRGRRVGVCVRPESLRVTSGDGVFRGVVSSIEYSGATRLCDVDVAVGRLQVEVPRSSACPRRGEHVSLGIDAAALHLISMEAAS